MENKSLLQHLASVNTKRSGLMVSIYLVLASCQCRGHTFNDTLLTLSQHSPVIQLAGEKQSGEINTHKLYNVSHSGLFTVRRTADRQVLAALYIIDCTQSLFLLTPLRKLLK